jgi:hypothetical protein
MVGKARIFVFVHVSESFTPRRFDCPTQGPDLGGRTVRDLRRLCVRPVGSD